MRDHRAAWSSACTAFGTARASSLAAHAPTSAGGTMTTSASGADGPTVTAAPVRPAHPAAGRRTAPAPAGRRTARASHLARFAGSERSPGAEDSDCIRRVLPLRILLEAGSTAAFSSAGRTAAATVPFIVTKPPRRPAAAVAPVPVYS